MSISEETEKNIWQPRKIYKNVGFKTGNQHEKNAKLLTEITDEVLIYSYPFRLVYLC